jgi:hypothetical protein
MADSRPSAWGNFSEALVAVLVGNLIYFFVMPHLPLSAQHRVFRQDWGVVVDFVICLCVFWLVKIVARKR